MSRRTYGQVNYEAFGDSLWPWTELAPEIKDRWERAAWSVIVGYLATHEGGSRDNQRDTIPEVNTWLVLATGEGSSLDPGAESAIESQGLKVTT